MECQTDGLTDEGHSYNTLPLHGVGLTRSPKGKNHSTEPNELK